MAELDYGTNRLHLCDHWDNYGMSFVLPVNVEKMIVHGGGYNEPPVATILMKEYIGSYDDHLFEAVCDGFHRAADEFIQFVEALCDTNIDTIYALWSEGNLGILPQAFDNSEKFELLVSPSEIVSIATAHLRAWKAAGAQGKTHG